MFFTDFRNIPVPQALGGQPVMDALHCTSRTGWPGGRAVIRGHWPAELCNHQV